MPESLNTKLASARRRWKSVKALAGSGWVFVLLAGLALLSFHIDRLIVLTTLGRYSWLALLVFTLFAGGILLIVLPFRKPIADEELAEQVERRYPSLQERLLTTVEMSRTGALAGTSMQMVTALAGETEGLAAPLDFNLAMPSKPAKRPVVLASCAAFIFAGHAIVAPGALSTWFRRILNPAADIPVYARTLVWVSSENGVVPRGEEIKLGVKVTGRMPEKVTLHYRFDGAKWNRSDIGKADNPKDTEFRQYSLRLPDAQQSVTFYATANDGRSNPHTIRVEDRPTILSVRVKLDYPHYTGKPSETVTATSGNIVAPVGTKAEIDATASKPLSEAMLVEAGKPQGLWSIQGDLAHGVMVVRKDETYGLHLKDLNGFEAKDPPQYTLHAQQDRTPEVQITKPGGDIERTPTGSLDVRVSAKDDYGVESLSLSFTNGKQRGSLGLPGANGAKETSSGGKWNLSSLHLKPGDTVTYEALARDGDNISGPHIGHSATYHVHILSDAEMRERIEAQRAQEREALRQLVERQKEAQVQLEQAKRSPEKAEKLAQAETAQRNVAQEATELARKMQQTTEQMRDNQTGAPADLRKREATQNAIQQLAQKAMPRAADTIQKASSQTSERSQNLSDAAKQEQQIRNELERLAQENSPAEDINKLASEAERLAAEQQRLAEQSDLAKALADSKPEASDKAKLDQLAKQQAALREQTQALQQQVAKAAQQAQDRGQRSASELSKAAQNAKSAGIQQKQSAAQKSLQSGKPGEASPKQNDAAQDLRDLANNLDQAGQKQSQEELQKQADQLEKAADKLNELANKEMELARQSSTAGADATRQLAEKQRDIHRQTEAVKPDLSNAPKAQQLVGQAQANMNQAAGELDKQSGKSANSPARQAAAQLRQAAMEALEAASNSRSEQAARELQQKVQELARDQRQALGQTRKLEAQSKSAKPDSAREKQLQDLAAKQTKLVERGQGLAEDSESDAFRFALREATRKMNDAASGLQQKNTGADTQRYEENAAQTLERIARALGQKADGEQQASQGGSQQSSSEQQMAQSSGDLQLARELQAQIRQETGGLDRQRDRNPGRNLTAQQQRELDALNNAERVTRDITNRAAQQMRSMPDLQKSLQRAGEEMSDVQEMMRQRDTGAQNQGTQDRIVGRLDMAMRQVKQAMREQRQQMAQGKQPGQQQGQQQSAQRNGNNPASRTFAPLANKQNGPTNPFDPRGRGFGALSAREQQMLREGKQEKVPAEYRELVNQYYRALSEHSK